MVDVYGAFIALAQPDISASPLSVDFGTVLLFRTSYKTVTITNNGTAELAVTSATITGTDATMFGPTNWTGSAMVAPGGSTSLKIVFRPTSRGPKSAVLTIATNDPDTPSVTVILSGSGR